MPSAMQQEPVLCTSKKRMRDEDDDAGFDNTFPVYDATSHYKRAASFSRQHPFTSPDHPVLVASSDCQIIHHSQYTPNATYSRKIILPLQAAKRIRVFDSGRDTDAINSVGEQHRRLLTVTQPRQHRAIHHLAATSPREDLQHANQHTREMQPAGSAPTTTTKRPTLAPCHICQRRPTKKQDLDSFADCEGCGLRTCYVCMRECIGGGRDSGNTQPASRSFSMEDADDPTASDSAWGIKDNSPSSVWSSAGCAGHRQMVCSRCCVEEGADGDIVCLGCLQQR